MVRLLLMPFDICYLSIERFFIFSAKRKILMQMVVKSSPTWQSHEQLQNWFYIRLLFMRNADRPVSIYLWSVWHDKVFTISYFFDSFI